MYNSKGKEGSYRIPVERDVAKGVLLDFVRGDDFEVRYGEVVTGLREEVVVIMEGIMEALPETIRSSNAITKRCKRPADLAVANLCSFHELDAENGSKISMLREDLCARLKWLIYEPYIRQTAAPANDLLRQKCKSVKTRKGAFWSLESLRSCSRKLRLFHHFWKNNFEANGNRLFEELVLPLFDKDLQESYAEQLLYSESDNIGWEEMTAGEIAETLVGSNKTFDPAEREWRWTDLENWVDKKGKPVGRFFVEFWRKEMENGHSDRMFREMILPELPEEWQANYRPKNKFRSFRPRETVQFLRGLDGLSLSTSAWGCGIFQSYGRGEGKKWYGYLNSRYGENYRMIFEKLFLPLFPEAERRHYMPKGFEFELKDGLERQAAAEKEDDPEKLHLMVREDGNRHAFEKLISYLGSKVESLTTYQLERVIHRYRPWIGTCEIVAYARVYASRQRMHEFVAARTSEFGRSVADPRKDEFDGRLRVLEELGLDEAVIMGLVELLGRGEGLAEIAEGNFDSEIKAAAAQVMELL